MKLKITTILIFCFGAFYCQNRIDKQLEELKKYTDNILENRKSEIINYVKLSDGRIKVPKTDDAIEEFDNDIVMSYNIVRKNDKIIYISKSDNFWGGIGDWYNSQDFYFNENGELLGAIKKEDWFLDNKCAWQIKYRGIYKNYGNPKLDRIDKFFNEKNKEIDLDSPNCVKSKKRVSENVEEMEKITFRNLEGFMKAEKIKYYRTDESEAENSVSQKIESEKVNLPTGSLIRRSSDPLGSDTNEDSRIGIDRKLISYIPGTERRGGEKPKHNCSVSGIINIIYTVNKEGNVISARRSGGVSDSCVISTSISWVKQFVKAEESTTSSTGTYRITF